MLKIEKDLNFVILFPELRMSSLKTTVSSIKSNFDDPGLLCVHQKGIKREVEKICPSVESELRVSSMINDGIKHSKKPWNLIVMAGNIINHRPIYKYEQFLESKNDIMYRVTDKIHWRWEDSSIHGLLIHKDAIKEVGELPDEEDLRLCKLLWMNKSVEKGYQFKGLVGVKLI